MDKLKINPITGRFDLVNELSTEEIAETIEEETADFTPNTTPIWPQVNGVYEDTQGKTAMQILKRMLVKDVAPSVAFTDKITNSTIYEWGNVLSGTFKLNPTQGTYSIASMELFVDNESQGTASSPSDESIWENVQVGTTPKLNIMVKGVITDSYNLSDSASLTYKFGHKIHYGFSESEITDASSLMSLNSFINNMFTHTETSLVQKYTMGVTTAQNPNAISAYFYIMIPTMFNCTTAKIIDNVLGLPITECVGEATITNSHSVAVPYTVFRADRTSKPITFKIV